MASKLHLARFDPWISYVFVILLAVAVRKWVEHPAQQAIGAWWKRRQASEGAGRGDRSAAELLALARSDDCCGPYAVTREPSFSPSMTRTMLPCSRMQKTIIGRLLSLQSETAVVSMTCRPSLRMSM